MDRSLHPATDRVRASRRALWCTLACLPLLLTGLTANACADPVVKLPAEIKAKPGRLLKLQAETGGKLVRWVVCSDDADLIPFGDGKSAIFCAPSAGRYRILAWTAEGDVPSEAAVCLVVVAG